jgi:hypothetical protein
MSGLPVTGEFARARKYLDDYHRYAFKLQNPDGSFSTEWFKGPGARPDLARRIQTSGHILEWLSYSLPLDQLDQPRVVKAVSYLSGVLNSGKTEDWSVGPLGHALHALAIYDERYFRQFDAPASDFGAPDSEQIVPTSGQAEVVEEAKAEVDAKAADADLLPVAEGADNAEAKASSAEESAIPATGSHIRVIVPTTELAPSRPRAK